MFNSKRLTVARQRKLYTKKELAEKIGVEPRTVSGYEAGDYPPSDEVFERIVRELKYPRDFFLADDLDIADQGGVSFRSMSKMSARQRDAAVAAASLAFTLSDWVDRAFDLPKANLPDYDDYPPEVAAAALRQLWGIGERPIKNMVHLLEAKGVRVFSLAENCVEVDAYSLWRSRKPYIFLNTVKSAERRRFDAAHELGHLLLHKHAAPNGLNAEKEAQEFASAFLMPTTSMRGIGRIAPSVSTLIAHKHQWNVSVSAMAYRLHSLQLISDWHYRSLCIEIQQRGYRTKEPNGSRPETSQVWQKVFLSMREDGVSAEELACRLALPSDELVKLVFGLVTIGLPSAREGVSSTKRAELRLVKG
ncbi:XRE family transcriptional regulator [Methylorubrum sp. SB2]|uniref:XRE family transcriptional regulator n=1 Tax=Methylorubrum subtropicum TaxID=3138812 RepID=UPI00313B0E5D